STEKLDVIQSDVDNLKKNVLLRLRNMNALDATGVNALEELSDFLQQHGKTMFVCGAQSQPGLLLQNHNFAQHIKEGLIFTNFGEASKYFRSLADKG
ncbi:MAG: sodium-independent anion transporter, partial [Armatimonadetes bacterium]|nr:sodium-independent anion transporter [Armatimonadota bacterium]